MESITHTVWQRRGSCVLFDQKSLAPFIAADAVISLRQALSWTKGLPSSPPVPGRTIVISGLETVIEIMSPKEAEAYLAGKVRPLLIAIQNCWTDCGIVFGFSAHPKAFVETPLDEEILFRRRDRKAVRLSDGIWDGGATAHMRRLQREGARPGEEVTIGYYVARIS
ncbi:MAG: hypothetical protein GX565_14765 [Lentisphaerae bacterium]|nr:hypothetical protein [Lentisphaerota bacterium]